MLKVAPVLPSAPRGAGRLIRSSMAVYDLAGGPEAEAGADVFLGGEEGLEDEVGVLGWRCRGRRPRWDSKAACRRGVRGSGGDVDGSVGIDGVGGVGDQVGDGLTELARQAAGWAGRLEVAMDAMLLVLSLLE